MCATKRAGVPLSRNQHVLPLHETKALPLSLILSVFDWLDMEDLGAVALATRAGRDTLTSYLTNCQHLHLHLRPWAGAPGLPWCAAFGLAHKHCRRLQSLKVWINTKHATFVSTVVARLVTASAGTLRRVEASAQLWTPVLIEALKWCGQLEALSSRDFSRLLPPPAGVDTIIALLRTCPRVRELDLSDNGWPLLTMDQAMRILDVVKHQHLRLTTLRLPKCIDYAARLLKQLEAPSLVGLRELHFDLPPLATCLAEIGQALEALPKLRRLDIGAPARAHSDDPAAVCRVQWLLPMLNELALWTDGPVPSIVAPQLESLMLSVRNDDITRAIALLTTLGTSRLRSLRLPVVGCYGDYGTRARLDATASRQLTTLLERGDWHQLREWRCSDLVAPASLFRALAKHCPQLQRLEGTVQRDRAEQQLLPHEILTTAASLQRLRLHAERAGRAKGAKSALAAQASDKAPSACSLRHLEELHLEAVVDATLDGLHFPVLKFFKMQGVGVALTRLDAVLSRMPALEWFSVRQVELNDLAPRALVPLAEATAAPNLTLCIAQPLLPATVIGCVAARLTSLEIEDLSQAEPLSCLACLRLSRLQTLVCELKDDQGTDDGPAPASTSYAALDPIAVAALVNPLFYPALRRLVLPAVTKRTNAVALRKILLERPASLLQID